MKARRVVVELEVTTDMGLKELKDKEWWNQWVQGNPTSSLIYSDDSPYLVVEQVQVNVVKK